MQHARAFARSESTAQLRRRIEPYPKRLAMLAFRVSHPAGIVGLPHFHLGGQTHDMAEFKHVGRQSRQHIDSILGEPLFTIEVYKVHFRPQQDRRVEQREIRQAVTDFRQALKRISSARLQRLQILTEQIRLSIRQSVSRQ